MRNGFFAEYHPLPLAKRRDRSIGKFAEMVNRFLQLSHPGREITRFGSEIFPDHGDTASPGGRILLLAVFEDFDGPVIIRQSHFAAASAECAIDVVVRNGTGNTKRKI